jgi:hypothetical protein
MSVIVYRFQTRRVAGNWTEEKLKQKCVAYAQSVVVNMRMG